MSLGFFGLATALTWPLLIRMSSGFYGFGNDNFGGIWQAEWVYKSFWGSERGNFAANMSFPFGLEVDERFVQPYDRLFSIVFGGIQGGLFSYNIQIFLSFVFAGVTMYALARYLTGSRPAAVIAGVIFTASPFHLAMGMQYHAMSSIQWCPLLLLAVIHALRTRRVRDAALAGAAFALVWITSYYYGWFSIWFMVAFLAGVALIGLWRAARARRAGRAIREGVAFAVTRGAAAAAAFIVIAIPLLVTLISKVVSDPGKYSRDYNDFAFTAVRPWQYILPTHDHPLFDSLTADVIQRHSGILPVYEQAVYLGVVPVLLAVVALVGLRRARPQARFAAFAMALGGAVCVLLTLGPYIPYNVLSIGDWLAPDANPHFTNPSQWVFDLSASFRYYGRAFVYTSVVLAALAAVGYALVAGRLERVRPWLPAVGAALVCALVLFEFANRPPERWVNLETPAWVTAVKQLPGDAAIVEYPIAGYSSPRSLFYIYWQTRHDHATVNPPNTQRTEAYSLSIEEPDSYLSGKLLRDKGVDFAVVHTKLPSPTFPPYQPAGPSDALPRKTGAANPWFEPHSTTSDAVIYRVLDRPRRNTSGVAGFGQGFGGKEVDAGGTWRWLMKDTGSFTVLLTSRRQAYLEFEATSFAVRRKVQFLADGRVTATRTLRPDQADIVKVPLAKRAGLQRLEVRATPGPSFVNDVLHNGDMRALAVRIKSPKVKVEQGRKQR